MVPGHKGQIKFNKVSSRFIVTCNHHSFFQRSALHLHYFSFFHILGGCLFDEPYSTCGYSQAEDDDFNWEQVNTLTKPTSDPWMPSGLHVVLNFLSKIKASL